MANEGHVDVEEQPGASEPERAITVHRHGAGLNGHKLGGGLADLPESAMTQLRLAHELRHALHDIEEIYDEAVAAAWRTHPDVAASLETRDQAQTVVDEWVERAKAQRVADRSTAPRADTSKQLKAAQQALRDAKLAAREAKAAAYPRVTPTIVAAGQVRKAATKAARQEFSKRGLYWGTSNDVISHHQQAVARIRSARKKGEPAKLRRPRWDGTGTLTTQPQRAAGDPPRTPALLASNEGKWANMLRVEPWVDPRMWEAMSRAERRRAGRGQVTMQVQPVASGGRVGPDEQVMIATQQHRMLPADADVALARVTRRRVGSRHTLAVSVTASLPPTPLREEGPAVAVHVGWRVRGDRSLRVATWVATHDLEVPANVADVVAGHGSWGEVVLPAAWRDTHEHLANIRAGRDKDLDRVKERLAGWLDDHGAVEVAGRDDPLTGADVRRWRSPARIATLLLRGWRDDPPAGDVGLVEELEAWRRHDKHLWNWEANGRKKLEGRRDDAWRRVAAWLGGVARVVIVDDVPIRDLTRVPGVGVEDDAQARAARANRVVAAPGRLRELIGNAAPRHGAALVEASAAHGTARHYRCGVDMSPAVEFADAVEVWCDTCRLPVDQDRNMASMLLAGAGQVAPPGRENTNP